MSEKKEEWEIGYSRENPVMPGDSAKTVNVEKADALVGQMLDGRFLVEKDLTEGGADVGGIGLVYLAQDLKLLGKKVVVKILKKSALQNENIVRKFLHEKEALIRLDHPNIVRILDSGSLTDGNPFIVLEFIEGYSLRRKLREKGRLPLSECAYLIEKIGNALSAVHSQNVLHRDLKPENVMLTPQVDNYELVRLIDFGIARVEDSKLGAATSIPQAIGTILYMAPEQLEGSLEQTPAADIYAFALVAYELLTGELPFKPNSIIEMYSMQQTGVQVLPSDIRPEIRSEADQMILQALAVNPSDRPQDARIFGRDLANALRLQSIQTEEIEPAVETANKAVPKKAAPIAATIPSPVQIPEPEPTESAANYEIPEIVSERKPGNSRMPLYIGLGVLILSVIGLLFAFVVWKSSDPEVRETPEVTENKEAPDTKIQVDPSPSVNTVTEKLPDAGNRNLTFYLKVQKMRDGKPFEEPFRSSGQEIFENGYKFQMYISPVADGFVYLFNEDKDAEGNTIFNILYPTPKTNNGSAEIKANDEAATGQNTFSGTRGTEIVWLIWTKERSDDLEMIRSSAFSSNGTLDEKENVRQLTDFLQKFAAQKPEAIKDTANQETVVKGTGDIVVHRVELEHR